MHKDYPDYSQQCRVRILKDLRHLGSKTGSYGTYIGFYKYPDTSTKDDQGLALIKLDNNEFIWGDLECVWTRIPMDENIEKLLFKNLPDNSSLEN